MPWSLVAQWADVVVTLMVVVAVVAVARWQARNDEKARQNANKVALQIASNANKVAVQIASNAYKAKLKGVCKIANSFFPEFALEVENIGPHTMVIRHIEMWVGKQQAKQNGHDAVEFRKKSENISPDYTFKFIMPAVLPAVLPDESLEVLEVGKSCTLFVPRNFDEKKARVALKEFVRNEKEAKTVQFVVCTDYGKFPVKTCKCAVDALSRAVTQKE